MGQKQAKKYVEISMTGPIPQHPTTDPRPPTVKQEAFAKTFPAMDALITSMVQHGTLIDKAEKELQTTNNSLDAVSAKETLACLALAKHKFDDQHFSLRKRYAETTQQLTQLVKNAQKIIQVEKTQEYEKSQDVTIDLENVKVALEKTIGDYIQEGLSTKIDELSKQNTDLDLPHLKHALPFLTKDLNIDVNNKALQRLTSPSLPFIPTKVIAMLIVNEDYSALRRLHDFKGFKNLETLRYDREKFIQSLKCFGVKEEDVREYRNLTRKDFLKTFNALYNECRDNNKAGEKTLVLFSYGGHGIQDGMTQALCSTTERKDIVYNLEAKTRMLAQISNTYVVALFDCCREKMSCQDIIYGNPTTSDGPSRGGSDGQSTQQDQNDQKHEDDGKDRNLVIVFGCKPFDTTPADSKLTVQFSKKVGEMSDTDGKIAVLPGILSSWKPNNKGEVLSFTKYDLIVPFDQSACPESSSHQADLKNDCIAKAKQATATKAKEQEVIDKDRLMFSNYHTDSIQCYTESTSQWTTLQCYDPTYVSYTYWATCMIDSKLFQLGTDRTCQMLIPSPDPATLKFTLEPRKSHPYKADWHRAIAIALPEDSCVLISGLKWDAGQLNSWSFNLINNQWSYKRGNKEDSPLIPAISCERIAGAGCRCGQAVYLFGGMNSSTNGQVTHIDRMDLRTWSEWQKIEIAENQPMHAKFASPVSETEILILSGKNVLVFDTKTEEVTSHADDSQVQCNNFPPQEAITNGRGQVFGFNSQQKTLIRVTMNDPSSDKATASVVDLKNVDQAENQVTSEVLPYDSNFVLNLWGVKELVKEQQIIFDHWYDVYFDGCCEGKIDAILYMMRSEIQVAKLKQVYAKHAAAGEEGDSSVHMKKYLNLQQQKAFLTEIWALSREKMPEAKRVLEEPNWMLVGKMKALQSLDQNSFNYFSWKDFKRGWKMMAIWVNSKRWVHTNRFRAAKEQKEKKAQEKKAQEEKAQEEKKE